MQHTNSTASVVEKCCDNELVFAGISTTRLRSALPCVIGDCKYPPYMFVYVCNVAAFVAASLQPANPATIKVAFALPL